MRKGHKDGPQDVCVCGLLWIKDNVVLFLKGFFFKK